MAKVKIPISMDGASFTGAEVQEARQDGTRATKVELKGAAGIAGQVAHYKMNDDAANTHVDDSLEAHDGVASANTEDFNGSGKINGDLEFSGTQYIVVSNHADFTFTGGSPDIPFSVAFWAWKNDWTSVASDMTVINKVDETSGDDEFEWAVLVGNEPGIRIICFDDTEGGGIASSFSTSGLASGWHHFAVAYDGGGVNTGFTCYFDGDSQAPSTGAFGSYVSQRNTGTDVYIGMNKDSGGNPAYLLDGVYIDDLRVYKNHVLTESDADTLYNSGSGTEDEFGSGYPTSTDVTLVDLDAQSTLAIWDMSTIELFEKPDLEDGTVTYQYAHGDSANPTNWNGDWLTKANLRLESDVQGQYFKIKTQLGGNGTQESALSDGWIECTIPTEFCGAAA